MKDYRAPENRREYFTALYRLNLDQGIMPGLVYHYFPALKAHHGWDTEQALWFAFLNGNTQNPLTSLRLFNQLPELPRRESDLVRFQVWFDEEWPRLQYDTDRRYQKKETVAAIRSYLKAVEWAGGSQETLLTGKSFLTLWRMVTKHYHAFGRLGAWSYLEYVKIMLGDKGVQADTLFFQDMSGSKSHRNGMLMLVGKDHLVWDKRAQNGFDGKYENFQWLCSGLQRQAEDYLEREAPIHPDAGMLTFESNLCGFKNSFFGRRYAGVYARMARDRLLWYASNVGVEPNYKLVKDIFYTLPDWLTVNDERSINEIAQQFPQTGVPVNAEYFL